jgi:hypothetical protein
VNDEIDRWVNLEGPPPDPIRDLLDAACDVPDLTPEQDARLTQRLYAAIAEDRRQRARQRTLRRGLAAALVATCLAALVVCLAPLPDGATAHRLLQHIEGSWLAKIARPPR